MKDSMKVDARNRSGSITETASRSQNPKGARLGVPSGLLHEEEMSSFSPATGNGSGTRRSSKVKSQKIMSIEMF
jgi:hypothetical protein